MATNADHQRAWRQRQKAKLAELERKVLTIRPRRPRRAKPTGEANDFIHELLTFTSDYIERADAWREQAQLSAEDREALWDRIDSCADDLSELAQNFLPTRKRKGAKASEAEHLGTMFVAKSCAPRRRAVTEAAGKPTRKRKATG